jgi:hypothetical protein
MKISRPMSVLAFLIASTLIAQEVKVTPLMSKDLAEFPGKEGVMITVVYPPGRGGNRHGKRKLVGHLRLWAICQPVGERSEFPTERRDTNGPGAVRRNDCN